MLPSPLFFPHLLFFCSQLSFLLFLRFSGEQSTAGFHIGDAIPDLPRSMLSYPLSLSPLLAPSFHSLASSYLIVLKNVSVLTRSEYQLQIIQQPHHRQLLTISSPVWWSSKCSKGLSLYSLVSIFPPYKMILNWCFSLSFCFKRGWQLWKWQRRK